MINSRDEDPTDISEEWKELLGAERAEEVAQFVDQLMENASLMVDGTFGLILKNISITAEIDGKDIQINANLVDPGSEIVVLEPSELFDDEDTDYDIDDDTGDIIFLEREE